MAIINKCCCCDVKMGSIVVAMWTLVLTTASVFQSARECAAITFQNSTEIPEYEYYTAFFGVMIALNACLGIAAVYLVCGIMKDIWALLIPYLIFQSLLVLVELALEVVIVVLLIKGDISHFNFLGVIIDEMTFDDALSTEKIAYGVLVAALFVGILIEVLSCICVISLLQQMRGEDDILNIKAFTKKIRTFTFLSYDDDPEGPARNAPLLPFDQGGYVPLAYDDGTGGPTKPTPNAQALAFSQGGYAPTSYGSCLTGPVQDYYNEPHR